YNEDAMDVEMYSFLNKGDASSYDNTLEEENGVYSIALSNEWVYPMSGTVFFVRKDYRIREKEEVMRDIQPEENSKENPEDKPEAKAEEKPEEPKKSDTGNGKPLVRANGDGSF
ncbi:MAG: hypothetical protein K6F31_04135, partial [Acetatifactor sp.]|nr:hypothetical protein [Acetatifactor sp.]